jgi:type I restriction enzyme R subunit/putative DNA methylase
MPAIAEILTGAIRQGAGSDYSLHEWVVMPNHVHLLITPLSDVSKALQKLKGASARWANEQLGLRGKQFWQREAMTGS